MNPGVRSDVAIMTHTPLRLGGENRELAVDKGDCHDYIDYTKQPHAGNVCSHDNVN